MAVVVWYSRVCLKGGEVICRRCMAASESGGREEKGNREHAQREEEEGRAV